MSPQTVSLEQYLAQYVDFSDSACSNNVFEI